MQIYIVAEIVYGCEGSPNLRAFTTALAASEFAKALAAENGEDNQDVLVIEETVELEG